MILSTLTTASLEDVRKAAPHAVLWYQLYIIRDRELSRRLVKRAERAGYSAIVLTVDSPTLGRKFSDVRGRFRLPSHLKLANFNAKEQATLTLCGSDLHVFGNSLLDPSLTWTDIEILPKIMRAVHGHIDVYLDGGVRQGTDVVKALALGAKMVFVGRPALWGLAYKAEGCKSYTLYGVVEHSGRMTGGHYVAYVRGAGGGWFYASDGRVAPAPQRKVLASQAYLLFYGRTDTLCQ
ncbi:peroxisomal (S)-2-hydroxy-acid oxidase GLO3 [Ixodes scapularis]